MQRDQQTENTRPGTLSLKEAAGGFNSWFQYFKTKKRFILLIALAGALAGMTYSFFKKSEFTATTTFVLEEDAAGGGLGKYAGLASLVGIDIGGMEKSDLFQGENIAALYRSRAMIERVLRSKVPFQGKETLLADAYINETGIRNKLSWRFKYKDVQFAALHEKQSRLADSLLGDIIDDIDKKYLQVDKVDKRMNVIGVNFTTCNEELAKIFNRELVTTVNQFYIETKTQKSADNLRVLQKQTDSVKAVMNGAIAQAANVVDMTPNLNVTRQSRRSSPVQTLQFNAEANKEILKELVKNLELTRMALLKSKPLIQLIDEPLYPIEDKKPGLFKMAAFGFLLGFIFSVFGLMFHRRWQQAMISG